MGKEKIQVTSLNDIGIRTQGAKDKGLVGTTDNLEDAQGRWQARNPIQQIVQALPKATERATRQKLSRAVGPGTGLGRGGPQGGESICCAHT